MPSFLLLINPVWHNENLQHLRSTLLLLLLLLAWITIDWDFLMCCKFQQHTAKTYFWSYYLNPAVQIILYLCLFLLGFGLLLWIRTHHCFQPHSSSAQSWSWSIVNCVRCHTWRVRTAVSVVTLAALLLSLLCLPLHQNIFHALLDIVNCSLSD